MDRELESALIKDFNGGPLRVYADWLEERGDPRAELIRIQLNAEYLTEPVHTEFVMDEYGEDVLVRVPHAERLSRRLLSLNWVRWFGELPRRALDLEWRGGFVRGAHLRTPLPGWPSCSPFLSLPIFRFLRSFTMGHRDFGGSAEELDLLPCLELLRWDLGQSGALEPWKDRRFARLQALWLTTFVEPDLGDLLALWTMHVPSLRHLRLELRHDTDAQTLTALSRTPWLSQLEALDVFVCTPEGAEALAKVELPSVPLTIALPAPLAISHRPLLRKMRPGAVLRPFPRQRRPDHEISDLEVTDTPHFAPDDFATCAPWVQGERAGEHFGAGISFAAAGVEHLFSLCRHCGSSDTLCIYLCRDEMERQHERIDWIRVEYVCRECAKFTHYIDTREH